MHVSTNKSNNLFFACANAEAVTVAAAVTYTADHHELAVSICSNWFILMDHRKFRSSSCKDDDACDGIGKHDGCTLQTYILKAHLPSATCYHA